MDSKLRSMAIITAVFAICFIGLFVVLVMNADEKKETVREVESTEESKQIYQTGQIGDDLSAFMQDDTFFDDEGNTYAEELKKDRNSLTLVVNSVERDMRIQILNRDNETVHGENFVITLNGRDEYRDYDKDGVVHITELDATDYEVTLNPIGEYVVPTKPVLITVKSKVEYSYIEDVSLLMKTEADIDALTEDYNQLILDADETEITGAQATKGNEALGIDVSKWQKDIDWDKVKKAGIEFAVIRCGYRGKSTGTLVEDPYFAQNIKAAKAAGVKVGIYFYSQAVNEVEAVEEASMAISLLGRYKPDYPIFIDTESAGGDGRADSLGVEQRTKVCEAFCATIESAGYESGVYASRNHYNKKMEMSNLENYTIWLAEYREEPMYQGYYHMWQYTSKGQVDGIAGNVNMNISYLGK